MSTPITSASTAPVTSPLAALGAGTASSTVSGTRSSSLDKDAFLKLLVAQLKYQDPSAPVDSSQFMAQTAQFTQVEKLDEMAKSSATSLALQQGLSASSLVGHSVTWLDTAGASHDGVVTTSSFGGAAGAEPTLTVGADSVPLSRITAVHQAG